MKKLFRHICPADVIILLIAAVLTVGLSLYLRGSETETDTVMTTEIVMDGVRAYSDEVIGDSWNLQTLRTLDITITLGDYVPMTEEGVLNRSAFESSTCTVFGTIVGYEALEDGTQNITVRGDYICTQDRIFGTYWLEIYPGMYFDGFVYEGDMFHGTVTKIKES